MLTIDWHESFWYLVAFFHHAGGSAIASMPVEHDTDATTSPHWQHFLRSQWNSHQNTGMSLAGISRQKRRMKHQVHWLFQVVLTISGTWSLCFCVKCWFSSSVFVSRWPLVQVWTWTTPATPRPPQSDGKTAGSECLGGASNSCMQQRVFGVKVSIGPT